MSSNIDSKKLSNVRNTWERRVLHQRYTSLVSLPPSFIKRLGYQPESVLLHLQEDGSLKITIVPIKNNSKKEIQNV